MISKKQSGQKTGPLKMCKLTRMTTRNESPKSRNLPLTLNPANLISIGIITLIAAAAFTVWKAPPAHAAKHKNPCHGSPLPQQLCTLIRQEAPRVKGAKVRWSFSQDLAVLLRRESGFDFGAVNPGHHDGRYRGRNHSCGMFQKLPCIRRVFRSHRLQVRDGLRYIANRYHSPRKARLHSDRYDWY